MENNVECIEIVLKYIEEHLYDETMNLDTIAKQIGYSKYHVHRMFSAIVKLPVHKYIQRRRLSEAAKMLVYTDSTILDIALSLHYETHRSFAKEFKKMYSCSPNSYRKRKDYIPLQVRYDVHHTQFHGNVIQDVRKEDSEEIHLIAYMERTKKGFHMIGKCWREVHKHKHSISHRMDDDFLIGVNDYHDCNFEDDVRDFTYIAGAQVSSVEQIPKHMYAYTLPASMYIVFTFRGKNEDSMQPAVEYIYQEYFPNSNLQLNEHAIYDFVKYGERIDEHGLSEIQYWVPIKEEKAE